MASSHHKRKSNIFDGREARVEDVIICVYTDDLHSLVIFLTNKSIFLLHISIINMRISSNRNEVLDTSRALFLSPIEDQRIRPLKS